MTTVPQIRIIPIIVGFGVIVGIYATTFLIKGTIGTETATGSFLPSGNAGKITLMNEDQINETLTPGLTLEGDGTNSYLKGNFFLQNVGYVSLDTSTVSVIPPAGADQNLTLPWEVRGNAWSETAGWIALDSQDPLVYSGVYYSPTTGSLTGIAWSSTIGYIDFSGNNSLGSEIVAGVKVIGNAGGVNNYESLFVTNNGLIKTASVLTPFINNVRKKVSLLTRNAPDSVINTAVNTQNILGNIIYYRLAGQTVSLSTATSFCASADSPRSIIVEGGNILIDRDVSGGSKACAIISLSNGTTGGNIYLNATPKKIMSYIVAEGSLYSGVSSSDLYNDTKAKLVNLPVNQLYVLGGVISRNTIGGSMTTEVAGGACPYTETSCDRNIALKYDLNFFRKYTKDPSNRGYKDATLDNYSLIIEYDSRAAGDVPPGL